MPEISKTHVLLWLLVGLFLFPGLGSYDLSAPDEPRFALVAREMMENGSWFMPHRNEKPYPDKPPLFFWSIAGFSYLLGGEVNAWSARLPSAFAALGALLLIFFWAKDKENPYKAQLTILTLVSSYRFVFEARMAQIDMLLCLLITASATLGYNELTQGPKRGRVPLIGLLLGLGILAKGPVAMIIPLGALLLFGLFKGKDVLRRFPKRVILWGLLPPLLWLIALLIQVAANGEWAYLENLLFKQTLTRYLNPWHHYKPFYYFFRVIISDFMPWSWILIAAIPFSKSQRSQLTDRQRFAWAFVIFTLFFFSLSKGKRDLYILPLYPFAAYLTACRIDDWIKKSAGWKASIAWTLTALILFIVGLAITLLATGNLEVVPQWVEISYPQLSLAVLGCLAIIAACTCVVMAWRKGHVKAFYSTVCSMFFIVMALYLIALPLISPYRSARRFMAEVDKHLASANQDLILGMVQYRSAYRFYGQNPLVELRTNNGLPNPELDDAKAFFEKNPNGWLIVRESHWEGALNESRKVHVRMRIGRGSEFLLIGPAG